MVLASLIRFNIISIGFDKLTPFDLRWSSPIKSPSCFVSSPPRRAVLKDGRYKTYTTSLTRTNLFFTTLKLRA